MASRLPLLLGHSRVDADGGKVALYQQLVQLLGSHHRLDKDADLVKLKSIQQVNQLAILFILTQLDIVLLQAVQRQLGLIVNVNLQGLYNRW